MTQTTADNPLVSILLPLLVVMVIMTVMMTTITTRHDNNKKIIQKHHYPINTKCQKPNPKNHLNHTSHKHSHSSLSNVKGQVPSVSPYPPSLKYQASLWINCKNAAGGTCVVNSLAGLVFSNTTARQASSIRMVPLASDSMARLDVSSSMDAGKNDTCFCWGQSQYMLYVLLISFT